MIYHNHVTKNYVLPHSKPFGWLKLLIHETMNHKRVKDFINLLLIKQKVNKRLGQANRTLNKPIILIKMLIWFKAKFYKSNKIMLTEAQFEF